jgi:hypothetical protein
MYYKEEKICEKLKITPSELKLYKDFGDIKYSEKTDKYDIESFLVTRTMQIGLEKLITKATKDEIIDKMEIFFSLKTTILSLLQKGFYLKNSGTNRLHRKIGKEKGFTNEISDSALSLSIGLKKSLDSWDKKNIKNLKGKIKATKNKIIYKKKKKRTKKKSKKIRK